MSHVNSIKDSIPAMSHDVEAGSQDVRTPSPERKEIESREVGGGTESPTYVSGVKLWSILFGTTLVCFIMLLDIAIIATAIPVITSDFHSLQDIGWYGAAYQLASATLQPLTGKIYSKFSSKRVFLAFVLLFEIGSLLCGVSVSSKMLIVGRAVAGMGASGLQNGAFTIIAGCVPLPKRPALTGFVIGFAQLGLVAGPLVGGALTQYATWRWCFYINLPIGGLAAALLVFVRMPEQAPKRPPHEVLRRLHRELDLAGFVIFAPAAIMLLLALQYGGNQYSWNSSTVIGLFCGSAVTFLTWIGWDYRMGKSGMIPLPMLRNRYVWASCLIMSFLSSAMFLMSYYLPVYFQGVLNKSPAISGVYLLPSILSQLLAAIISGRFVGKMGYYLPWSAASGLLTAIGYGLLSTLGSNPLTGDWIGYQILTGAGRGMGLQIPVIAVQSVVEPAQIPTAMSLVIFSQTLGGALFLSFAGTAFTNSLTSLLKSDAPVVDCTTVIRAGAYGFRHVVSDAALPLVLNAYVQTISRIFYMCASLAAACFALSWATGWVDICNPSRDRVVDPEKDSETARTSTEAFDGQ